MEQRWVIGVTSLASFMISLDSLVVATALTAIHRSLHASLASLEWTVNAYNLVFAVLLLTGAALGDRLGRRRTFGGGLALFCLASAGCALAPNAATLITARAVQGAGAAVVLPLALTQLSAAVPPQLRGKALGIFSGAAGLGTFLGPVVGGAVSQGLAWQWIFWVNIPIGAVAILLAFTRLAESTGPGGRFDTPGVLLATTGALGLVWGLIRGNTQGWRSGEVLGSLVVGALLVVAFVGWEARARAPMLPLRFFRSRAFTAANLANTGLFASLYGTLFLTAMYLQSGLGYGPFGAGLRLIPWTGTLMVCAPVAGALADRYGERWFVVFGLLVNAASMAWLSFVAGPDAPYLTVVLPLIVAGCGISMAMPAAQKAVVGSVRPPEIGQASGAFMTLRIFAGVLGIAALTAVFAGWHGSLGRGVAFAQGYGPAMMGAGLIAAAAAVAGVLIPGRRAQVPPPGPAGNREDARPDGEWHAGVARAV